MPQVLLPSECFLRKGHLNTSSQHAPQRLHSPRRRASAAITSCLRKLRLTKRRSFPWACRARSFASSTVRERNLCFRRASNELWPVLSPWREVLIGFAGELLAKGRNFEQHGNG